jgi:hypothetical protein
MRPGFQGAHSALPGTTSRAKPWPLGVLKISTEQRQEQEMPGLRPEDSSPGLGTTILAKRNDAAGIEHKKRVIRESRSSGLEDHRPAESPSGLGLPWCRI